MLKPILRINSYLSLKRTTLIKARGRSQPLVGPIARRVEEGRGVRGRGGGGGEVGCVGKRFFGVNYYWDFTGC